MTYAGEVFGELTFTALFGQLWALPFLIFINIIDITSINKWIAWAVMTALLCYPNGMLPVPSPVLSCSIDQPKFSSYHSKTQSN